MVTRINHCRICGNSTLIKVLDLGDQALTGVFPLKKDQQITRGPLQLLKCHSEIDNVCGLLQLAHSYDPEEMYGDNYGYRSGLNSSMVSHLNQKIKLILEIVNLDSGDIVIDIGSNDSTTLQAYPDEGLELVGIDPTGEKFKEYYPSHIKLISNFFSLETFRKHYADRKAKVVTSFSMFYDLESPIDFMCDVRDILHSDGIWVFEQSYMPTMLKQNSYDTVCHEHIEYYGLQQIKWMTDKVGLKIIDVDFNSINGGSFSVSVAHSNSNYPKYKNLQSLLEDETHLGFKTLKPYEDFAKRVKNCRLDLLAFIDSAKSKGKTLFALGASTKGNVILQYCGITSEQIPFIGEINPDKVGSLSPGSLIPIISEQEILLKKPDYLIILPWHFRDFFEKNTNLKPFKLIFPLPNINNTDFILEV
jgi:NDP-4-keto-2,6-dideoxyhexose 3-C-methyltransferase